MKASKVSMQNSHQERDRNRLAAIVSSSEDAIYSKDRDGIIQTWNHAAEKMFGYKAQEAIGNPVDIIIPPQKYEEEMKVRAKLKQGRQIRHFQTLRRTKNGKILHVFLTISPIFDNNKEIIGFSTITRDITQKVLSQNRLSFLWEASKVLSSSLDYKQTLHNVAKLAVPHVADWCAIDMKTEKGIERLAVSHINPDKVKWAEELYKKNPPNLESTVGIGKVLRTGKFEFVSHITEKMLIQAAKNEEELKLLKKLQLSAAMIIPMKLGNNILGAISFISAESGHYYTKSDLAIAQQLASRATIAIDNANLYTQAQNSVKVRDAFISLASHELKTPLTSIKMFVQVLERQNGKKDYDNFATFIQKMEQQVDKLTLLVNDLLDISKIQHGKLNFSMDYFDLNDIIRETVEMLQKITRHQIVIKGKVEKKVYADKYRIYQVLTNLIDNAIKYSQNANKVIVTVKSKSNGALVTVRDFGFGIVKEQQKKIFSEFFRVSSSSPKEVPGLGIGLYISNEIIKKHNSIIKVDSEKGRGSSFSFILPYHALQES